MNLLPTVLARSSHFDFTPKIFWWLRSPDTASGGWAYFVYPSGNVGINEIISVDSSYGYLNSIDYSKFIQKRWLRSPDTRYEYGAYRIVSVGVVDYGNGVDNSYGRI